MEQVIYLDSFLITNFTMNYLLLYIVKRFFKMRTRAIRIALSALLGSVYVIILFYPRLNFLSSLFFKLLVSFIMIYISFRPKELIKFIKIFSIFYIAAFLTGGCILGIFYLINLRFYTVMGVLVIEGIKSIYLIVGFAVSFILVKVGFNYFDNYYKNENCSVKVFLFMEGRSCNFDALLDTGNNLKDPISKRPVVVADLNVLIPLFPNELQSTINEIVIYGDLTTMLMNSDLKNRIRLIPFSSIGAEGGLLVGLRTDEMILNYKGNRGKIENPIIAIYNRPLSLNGLYRGLACPEIIKEGLI